MKLAKTIKKGFLIKNFLYNLIPYQMLRMLFKFLKFLTLTFNYSQNTLNS